MIPALTVVVVLYQPEKAGLKNFFHSLARQSEPYHLIVLDNSPLSKEWKELMPPSALFHRFRRNVGYARAVNWALKKVTTPYVLVSNFDVVLAPDCLQHLREAVEKNPDAAGVCPKVYLSDFPGYIDSVGIVLDEYLQAANRGIGMVDVGQFDLEEILPALSFSCVLLSMEAVQRVGGLPDDYFLYYEDVEWCLRARKFSYSFRSCPEAKVWHQHSAAARALNPNIKQYLLRSNLLRTAFLHLPLRDFFHIFLFHLALFFPFRQPFSSAIFSDFFLHFPYLLFRRFKSPRILWRNIFKEPPPEIELFHTQTLQPQNLRACLFASLLKLWEVHPEQETFRLLQKLEKRLVRI